MTPGTSPQPLVPPPRAAVSPHPITLSYRDPTVEAEFWCWSFDRNAPLIRGGWAVALAVLAGLGVVEWALFPELYLRLWAVRYGLIVPVCAGASLPVLVPRWRARFGRRRLQEIIFGAALVGYAGIGWIGVQLVQTRQTQMELYLGLGYMVAVTMAYLGLRLRFIFATALGLVTYVVSVWVLLSGPSERFAAVSMVGFGAMANVFGMFGAYTLERAERSHFETVRAVQDARARVDALLSCVLPDRIATRLKAAPQAIADSHDAVTVLFADIAGFTPLSAELDPRALVALLDRLFSAFDRAAARHGVEKIKTIGDAWMATAGASALPTELTGAHGSAADAVAMARLALDLRAAVQQVSEETGRDLGVRIGIHRGPVVAGVIGRSKFLYDLWGDTVNVASRMESHGEAGRVQITEAVHDALGDGWRCEPRGPVQVKGRGAVDTWWLLAEEAQA